MEELVGRIILALAWALAGVAWSLPFVIAFVWYYDTKTEKLRSRR